MVLCGQCGKQEATHVLHAEEGDYTFCEQDKRMAYQYGNANHCHKIRPNETISVPTF